MRIPRHRVQQTATSPARDWPDASKAVCLKLDPDLQAISVDPIHSSLRLLQPQQQPQLVLHVVADLMGNHIGLGELTRLVADIASLRGPETN